jgi:hypothetical protein
MIHVDPAHIAPDPARSSPVGGSGGPRVPACEAGPRINSAVEGGRPEAGAPEPATASARAVIDGQMAVLTRLTEIGMEIAEACGRDARAAAAANTDAQPIGLVFARVARAVRMTIALQSRLMKDLAALDRADDLACRARTTKRRMRLSRLVDEAARAAVDARREAGGRYWADEDAVEDEIEQLASEAYERLTDAEDDDLTGLSFTQAAARVAADLGLGPDWTARLLTAMAPPTSPTPPGPGKARPESELRVAGGGPPPNPPPLGVACEARGAPGREATRWEGVVEGESPTHSPWPAPSTARSSARGPPPAIASAMGEVAAPPGAPGPEP